MYKSISDLFTFHRADYTAGTNMDFVEFHEGYEIYFLLEGKKNYLVNGTELEMKAPSLLFLQPMAIHRAFSRENSSHRMAVLAFQKEFLRRYEDLLPQLLPYREGNLFFEEVDGRVLENYVDGIACCYAEGSPLSMARLQGIIFGLLCDMKQWKFSAEIGKGKSTSEKKDLFHILSEIRKQMTENLSVSDLAQQFGYTADSLTRMLKKQIGMGFREYLFQVRLEQAVHLLKDTDISIGEIALQCGYEGLNYFGDAFRKKMGCSPREFRSKIQKEDGSR